MIFSGFLARFVSFLTNFAADMEQEQKLKIEEDIIKMLKTVYDPELPVDVYSLGLIYKIDLKDDGHVDIDMTLTAPNCPIADFIFEDVRQKVESVDGVASATVNLVFEPEWDPRMMTEEAKLELGML
jgi:FeS assembly SUF system protein